MPSNVLPPHFKQTFPPIFWIFTEGEGGGIESRLPFKIFSSLPVDVCCFFAVGVVVVGDAVAVVAVVVVAPVVGNIVGVGSATYGRLDHRRQVAEVGDAVIYDGCGDAQSHFVDLHEPEKSFFFNFALSFLIL